MSHSSSRRPLVLVTAAALVLSALAALTLPRPADGADAGPLRLAVVSSKAWTVTGRTALVRVAGVRAGHLRASVDGRAVASPFRGHGATRVGLVRGLHPGANRLVVINAGRRVVLTINAHPLSGPVFSGRPVQPIVCHTEDSGLRATHSRSCMAPTVHRLYYRSSATGQFMSYDPDNPPADLDHTTTDQGRTVPFIVREEIGTLNRAVYKIAMLWNPAAKSRVGRQRAYNRKVLVPLEGGCEPSHAQGVTPDVLGSPPAADLLDGSINAKLALGKGFAVLSSSHNYLGQACNPTLSAETLGMVKERLAESTRAPIRYTIGQGCSGGSVQQFVIAAAYPGLIDGLIPMCSFPDLNQVVQEAQDCTLLNHVFNQESPALWANQAQRDAVLGYASPTPCTPFYDTPAGFAGKWFDPSNADACHLPAAQVYDARTNPDGVRCTLQDYAVATFGRRAKDGFANRPYDNVGVQYGLRPLQSGTITAEQFVDLNEKVGGRDIDYHLTKRRSRADQAAITAGYRSGWVMSAQHLARTPIIDLRGTDPATNHTDVHSYSIRARLQRDNGTTANYAMWTGVPNLNNDPVANRKAFLVMDRWLTHVERDHRGVPLPRKVIDDKPPLAVDSCWAGGHQTTDAATCRAAFPYFADTRIQAGGPLTDDVLKCHLRALRRGEYNTTFTDDQWRRLQAAFPHGACDYRRPSIGQQPTRAWRDYSGRG